MNKLQFENRYAVTKLAFVMVKLLCTRIVSDQYGSSFVCTNSIIRSNLHIVIAQIDGSIYIFNR